MNNKQSLILVSKSFQILTYLNTNKLMHYFFFNFNFFVSSNFNIFTFIFNNLISFKIKSKLKKKIKFKIYKNLFNNYSNLLYFFNYFIFKKYKFKFKFKYLFLFFLLQHTKKTSKLANFKNFNNNFTYFNNSFYRQFRYKFYKSSYKLVGLLISPFDWEFKNKKNWLKQALNLKMLKLKTKNELEPYDFQKKILKKIYFNNFFYFTENKINFKNLIYFSRLKIPSKKIYLSFYDSKPYTFLKNASSFYFLTNPVVKIYSLLKKYIKIDFLIDKISFANRLKHKKKLKKRNKLIKLLKTTLKQKEIIFALTNQFKTSTRFKKLFNNNDFLKFKKKKNFFFKKRFLNNSKSKIYKTTKYLFFKIKLNKKLINTKKFILAFYFFAKYSFWKFNKFKRQKLGFHFVNIFKKFYFKHSTLSNYLPKFNLVKSNTFNFNLSHFTLFSKKNKTSIFKNIKNTPFPFFQTKETNNFILPLYGFTFLTNITALDRFNLKFNRYLVNFKRTKYSFSLKNDFKKFILKKYLKHKFFYIFNSPKLKDERSSLYLSSNLKSSQYDSNFFQNNLLTKVHSTVFPSLLRSEFDLEPINILNTPDTNLLMSIKRIKFKPGYSTIWREARNNLKFSFNLNFKYQLKLTKYLSKLNKIVKFKLFLFLELQLLNILIKARFFPDYSIIKNFLSQKNVFVNGIICTNPNLQLYSNDFIQFYINLKYYIVYRWILNWSIKKKIKLKKKTFKKNAFIVNSDEKIKSKKLPNWIVQSRNSIEDIISFLEVDYLTLSAFVLYEPTSFYDFNVSDIFDKKYSIINLYNWKYIT